jgi:hypothetical protein
MLAPRIFLAVDKYGQSFRPGEASAGIHNPCIGYLGKTGVMDFGSPLRGAAE